MPETGGHRVALVTGAGRGIGRAHALELARRGAIVVVNDLDLEPARTVVAEIEAARGTATVDGTDVGSIAGGRAAVAAVVAAHGRIEILVNNAGIVGGGGTVEHPVVEELDALRAVHVDGALGTMAAAIADMRTRGWGRIVNTVSEAALDPRFAGGLGYGMAKAALWSATLAAAVEAAPHGITVNGLSPGARTRMNAELLDAGFRDGASQRLDLDPAHVAAVLAALVAEDAGDITGRIVHAAGGHVREYVPSRAVTPLAERLARGEEIR